MDKNFQKNRILIVSNRLPFAVKIEQGELVFKESAGGLVSGLSAYLDSLKTSSFIESEYLWIGWPGITVKGKKMKGLKEKAIYEFKSYPVFLSEKDMDNFYHGFCNKTIWPLFHYFPSYTIYSEDYWNTYKNVNEIFCDTILEILKKDDVLWIHDYHLMLLPKLIREKRPDLLIGFFLHIPFPSFEIFRLLPSKWRSKILEGLLGADLIGFHTNDYTQYFLRCALRILGYEHNIGSIILNDRIVKADTFPMGIDFNRYYSAINSDEIKTERDELKKNLNDLKVILSIDRLDYSKGIYNRLGGYEIFLEKNPNWHKKVVLIVVVVPSRIGVEHYNQMKKQIDEIVGKINGRFGSIDWTPIIYRYDFLPFNSLTAYYSISDVALITPLRDGMNLIAKEYIATRTDKKGVLILSEMAGAVKELGEAIIINPNNIEEIADAINEALQMPEEEQIRRNKIMQERLKQYDVVKWANDFIQELTSLKEEQKRFSAKLVTFNIKEQLVNDFYKAKKRIIFLDYDGTLVPFEIHPQFARPNEIVLELLKLLSEIPDTEVVLISGRDKNTLQMWFGKINIGMVAEHGVWLKEKNNDWQLIKPLISDWKQQLLPMLKMYVDRLPNSFIEEKEFSIVWHYRRCDPELSSIRAKELIDDLVNFTANIDVQVLQGSKVVEIKSAGVNKGVAGLHFLSKENYDFILGIGDDWTDEDLFKILPENAYSIKVGIISSNAKFNLANYLEVLNLIKEIVKNE